MRLEGRRLLFSCFLYSALKLPHFVITKINTISPVNKAYDLNNLLQRTFLYSQHRSLKLKNVWTKHSALQQQCFLLLHIQIKGVWNSRRFNSLRILNKRLLLRNWKTSTSIRRLKFYLFKSGFLMHHRLSRACSLCLRKRYIKVHV